MDAKHWVEKAEQAYLDTSTKKTQMNWIDAQQFYHSVSLQNNENNRFFSSQSIF